LSVKSKYSPSKIEIQDVRLIEQHPHRDSSLYEDYYINSMTWVRFVCVALQTSLKIV